MVHSEMGSMQLFFIDLCGLTCKGGAKVANNFVQKIATLFLILDLEVCEVSKPTVQFTQKKIFFGQ